MTAANREKRRIDGRCVTCGTAEFPITVGTTICSRCAERQKAWRKDPKNKERLRAWGRAWREKNRERSRELNAKYNRETKAAIMAMYGGACACCDEQAIEFLTLDHINNDGGQDRGNAGVGHGGYRHYKKLLREPRRSDLQILCVNCHHAKTFTGACPHERRESVPSLDAVIRDVNTWQAETFPRATPASVVEHLRREINELVADPTDTSELADVVFLAVGLAYELGVDLTAIVAEKLAINRARVWGQPDEFGVVEHLRDGVTP